ncbi:Uncharacterised protein [Mycobacterium tuberculosis]|nr:Uncharacterised protein [Mycobacterium tuberculosis]
MVQTLSEALIQQAMMATSQDISMRFSISQDVMMSGSTYTCMTAICSVSSKSRRSRGARKRLDLVAR